MGCLLLLLSSLGTLFGSPWPSFWPSKFQIHRLVSARSSPDECWRIPAEFKRILRNRFVIIGIYRHLTFSKVPIADCHSRPNPKSRGGGGASPAGRLQLWRCTKTNFGRESRQRSKAKVRNFRVCPSTPSPMGRRSAPRIPPGPVHFRSRLVL